MSLFAGEDERENSQKRVLWLLEALARCDQLYLQQHPDTPLMYQSGIKYTLPEQFEKAKLPELVTVRKFLKDCGAPDNVQQALETLGELCGAGEHFREIPRIIENGGGDCDNVAAWRVAELRELGVDAKPYITWRRRADGGMTYHVVVLWPDGSSEDPSLLLGMGGAAREIDRQHEIDKLAERMADYATGKEETIFGKRNEILGHGGGGHGGHGGHGGGHGGGGFRGGYPGWYGGWDYDDYDDDDDGLIVKPIVYVLGGGRLDRGSGRLRFRK